MGGEGDPRVRSTLRVHRRERSSYEEHCRNVLAQSSESDRRSVRQAQSRETKSKNINSMVARDACKERSCIDLSFFFPLTGLEGMDPRCSIWRASPGSLLPGKRTIATGSCQLPRPNHDSMMPCSNSAFLSTLTCSSEYVEWHFVRATSGEEHSCSVLDQSMKSDKRAVRQTQSTETKSKRERREGSSGEEHSRSVLVLLSGLSLCHCPCAIVLAFCPCVIGLVLVPFLL
ncbi:hypothetical protein Tco_0989560 [Tanacetum coccineum]|uniref:Transmembrane protein n=1 Tax=Tanacetum coccineum TaxID=301880 RepID=A0ABQ5EU13_9ASTR